ncbi:MAG: OstA-like protein [Bacteroidota bacterium]|nr:OstA-like protein [Bacteroidota bacterium]
MRNFALLLLTGIIFTQTLSAQKKKKIEYNSDVLYTTELLGPKIKILTGHVVFYHENSTMSCDSALFNISKNLFDAFGNIKVIKPTEEDTVFLYGDTLHYNGNLKIAKVRNRVSLLQDSLRLYTDSIDYDLNKDLGYYSNGGTTINGQDTLSSIFGYYYANRKELFFKEDVIINNPRFEMFSDTLRHNTEKRISYFLGPTEIYSEENYIYCENGWYDHNKHQSEFSKNALLQNEEQSIKGQLISYDRNKGIGIAHQDVEINDSTQNIILQGNYGYYNEKTEFSLLTDSAVFIQITSTDSLFLHADTIKSSQITEKTENNDSIESKYRLIQAYNKVKIYKSDFQAKCDSLVYSFRDSIMEMHNNPVIWSDENQLTADFIKVLTVNREVDQVNMETNSFIISESDSLRYNQIKGNRMIGFVRERELKRVDVFENGESLYFLKDDADLLIGSNHIRCKNMKIYLEDQEIDKIWFFENPEAVMKPPNSLSASEKNLIGFRREGKQRPKSKEDIFNWIEPPVKEEAVDDNSDKEKSIDIFGEEDKSPKNSIDTSESIDDIRK